MHIPVLLNEVIEGFSSLKEKNNLVYFDGTFGRGGHYREIKKHYQLKEAFATDQDRQAIDEAYRSFPEIQISHENFLDFARKNTKKLDIVLLDLGVSSPQLDQAERGFSFLREGPLDMRMNQSQQKSASDLVAELSEQELIELFSEYGEIQRPQRVARAIVQDRQTKPFSTTLQLAQMIERVDGWRQKGFHPATQYFMALRLAVNSELEVVAEALPLLISQLNDQGRVAVITFHSLEDRIVKNIFKDSEGGFAVNKKVIVATDEECHNNPRARSAKLRIFQKGQQPEKPDKFAVRRAQLK